MFSSSQQCLTIFSVQILHFFVKCIPKYSIALMLSMECFLNFIFRLLLLYKSTIDFLNFKKDFTYFREGGREEEREGERNINVWLPLLRPPLRTWPATQACALTGNWTTDLWVLRPVLYPLSHTSQSTTDFFLCIGIVLWLCWIYLLNIFTSSSLQKWILHTESCHLWIKTALTLSFQSRSFWFLCS